MMPSFNPRRVRAEPRRSNCISTKRYIKFQFLQSFCGFCHTLLDIIGSEKSFNMSEGRLVKPDKDYTKEADTQIQEAQELAKVVPLHLSKGKRSLTL